MKPKTLSTIGVIIVAIVWPTFVPISFPSVPDNILSNQATSAGPGNPPHNPVSEVTDIFGDDKWRIYP